MRQADKKYFGDIQQGRLNSDDSPFVVGTNEWVNAENIRTGSTDKGFTGIVESVGGNAEAPKAPSAFPFYLNVDDSSIAPYLQLGTTPSTTPQTSQITFSSNYVGFLTSTGIPGITNIDAGTWNISCFFDASTMNTPPIITAKVSVFSNTNYQIGISSGVTIYGYQSYNFSINISQTTILPTDRIAITFYSNVPSYGILIFPQSLNSSNNYSVAYTNLLNPNNNYITIGSTEDTENKRILYFNYDDSIYREDIITSYDLNDNKQYTVLSSSQVIGGLNFSKFSLIHSAKISNLNILSWVDGINNEPRKINIDSGIKANNYLYNTNAQPYSFPLNFSEITLIKPPPIYPPSLNKIFSNGTTNFIQFESFEFCYQFEYYDNEITIPGTYSLSSRLNHTKFTENFNSIQIVMGFQQDIPKTVKKVNLISRVSNGNPIGGTIGFIVKTWSKLNISENQEIENHNNNIQALSFIYYNDISGQPLPSDDVLRAFDNVPVFSQTHEVSKNRLFLGNNIEGYNTPKNTSLNVFIDNKFTPDSPYINLQAGAYKAGFYNSGGTKWSAVGYFVYINGIAGNPTGFYYVNNTGVYHSGDANANIPNPCPTSINFSDLTYTGTNQTGQPWNFVIDIISGGRTGSWSQPHGIGGFSGDGPSKWGRVATQLTGFANNIYDTFAQKSKYELGVVFYDYAMRKSGVCNINNNPIVSLVWTNPTATLGISKTTYLGSNGNFIYLKFNTVSINDIISGDSLVITGSTGFNGTYVVNSILFKNVDTTSVFTEYKLYVNTTVPSLPATQGTVSVNRIRGTSLNTPIRDYNYTSGYGQITWTLNNTNALSEIPDWAYYYSIVKTLNLRTRFFLESVTSSAFYITKTSAGLFEYTNKLYISFAVGIAIDIFGITYSGLGYTYSQGDICILLDNLGNIYEIPIIGQDGNYIHLQNNNIGNLQNVKFAFQIYTPYKTSSQEPYYEYSQMFPIINPKTTLRNYSTTNGIIPADSYIIQRYFALNTYFANAMSPNDLYWKRWDSDAGKSNIITELGQTDKITNITWSDTYISGTQINGSSTFRLGSETFVSDDCGSITKLQLTSKVQDQGQGSVMLALCNSEINSMYLGETQIADSTGKTQFFSASTSVVSTINILKGNYGCISPESVVQYRGKVYFVDLSNGRVVQYSDNGLDAISNVKMSRFWKNWAYKYQSLTKAQIEAFGDRPYIFSIVDSGHDELLISLPKLSDDPPKGYLPDYPNTPYPFDILDYQGKTLVYCLGTAAQVYPHWQGAFTFTTENFVSLQNRLFSFKGGRIFEHNQDIQNRFYGAYSPSSIMFTSNILSQVPKVYDNFVAESNLMPSFVYFYNNYPYIQTSDLDDTSFVNLEGIWYANILRNKIVPTTTGFTTDGLLTAEVMRNTNMYVQATFPPTTEPLELRLLQLGTSISKGHIIT
jgi:hypothetical protein